MKKKEKNSVAEMKEQLKRGLSLHTNQVVHKARVYYQFQKHRAIQVSRLYGILVLRRITSQLKIRR